MEKSSTFCIYSLFNIRSYLSHLLPRILDRLWMDLHSWSYILLPYISPQIVQLTQKRWLCLMKVITVPNLIKSLHLLLYHTASLVNTKVPCFSVFVGDHRRGFQQGLWDSLFWVAFLFDQALLTSSHLSIWTSVYWDGISRQESTLKGCCHGIEKNVMFYKS